MVAYRRKRTNKKKTYKRRRPAQSLSGYAISAIKGFALKKLKDKLGLNTESKYLDTTVVSQSMSDTFTGVSTAITIPQGNTTNTRSGNSCRMTSYVMRFSARQNTSATASCRFRLIGWVQPKLTTVGTPLGISDILEDHTSQLDTPYDMNAVGFNIIYDKTFELAGPASEGSTKSIFFTYNPLSHHIEWNDSDTTGSSANLLQGNIRFAIASDASVNFPVYSTYTRVKFVDN